MNDLDRDGDAGLDSLQLRIPPSYSMQTDDNATPRKRRKVEGCKSYTPTNVGRNRIQRNQGIQQEIIDDIVLPTQLTLMVIWIPYSMVRSKIQSSAGDG